MGRGPTGVIKSILDTSRTDGKVREEIFVDIVEKISCTFSSSGALQNSQIDGAIQVGRPARALDVRLSIRTAAAPAFKGHRRSEEGSTFAPVLAGRWEQVHWGRTMSNLD